MASVQTSYKALSWAPSVPASLVLLMCPVEPTSQEVHCSPQDSRPTSRSVPWKNRPFRRIRKGRQKTGKEAEREGKGKKIQSKVVGRGDDGSRQMAEKVAGKNQAEVFPATSSFCVDSDPRIGSCQTPH